MFQCYSLSRSHPLLPSQCLQVHSLHPRLYSHPVNRFPSIISLDSICSVTQSCPTLCDAMDCSPPDSSIHGILQARIVEWVVISFSRARVHIYVLIYNMYFFSLSDLLLSVLQVLGSSASQLIQIHGFLRVHEAASRIYVPLVLSKSAICYSFSLFLLPVTQLTTQYSEWNETEMGLLVSLTAGEARHSLATFH